MTKEEFKSRWESDSTGGGITFDEVAQCAKDWGIFGAPKTRPMDLVLYRVLCDAQTSDCEDYNPIEEEED
ncbi:hypothetical protein [Nodosilinea nodulosa]|uniref:hypothetical protein n=1 Tax=Nodosilinea nodulosa TaxID=416001 RepID=UPI0002FF998F|nr:hypothetical protein [Nodosilinea nodulosa]